MNKMIGTNRTEKVNKMNDKKLYKLCKKFGAMALTARRKFAGLLPEVLKRRLYEKRGFSSIYEFAAKLAGMSREQVDLVIRLERKFSDKPLLREALTEGEISACKLARITSIVTDENQEEIFETVKLLSNRAVDVFVKDVKREKNETENYVKNQNQNGLFEPLFDQKSLRAHDLKLAVDVEKELSEMQEKGIDINEFLREAIRQRKENIEKKKNEICREMALVSGRTEKKDNQQEIPQRDSENKRTHITAKTKKLLREEHGTKCSIPGCKKPAKIIHHTQRFSITYNNDPHFLAPMCEEHHEIAHKIDLKYAEKANLHT